MTQSQFKKLRMTGQFGGGLVLAISIVLMFTQQSGLYFLGGFAVFWIINYPVIHVFIGNRFVTGQQGAVEDT